MLFAIPLVVGLGVAGVHSPIGQRLEAPLSPTEKRQLGSDRWVGVICPILATSHHWRMYHLLGGLDNLQIVLIPLPGEVGPARRRCWAPWR